MHENKGLPNSVEWHRNYPESNERDPKKRIEFDSQFNRLPVSMPYKGAIQFGGSLVDSLRRKSGTGVIRESNR